MTTVWIIAGMMVLIVAASAYFASLVIHPRTFPLQKTVEIEVDKGRMNPAEYAAWEKQEISLPSPHGYPITGTYLPLPGAQKTAILVHGFTYTRYGSVKYVPIFRSRGYNTLIIDLRYHGGSGGDNTTFGYFEKDDLKVWTDWAFGQLGADGRVGLHGESMGASIALQYAPLDPRLAFVIADCGFSDLRAELTYRMRVEYHLPAFPVLDLANVFCWLLTGGMTFGRVSPIRIIDQIHAPLFFIHGQSDGYILPKMSVAMYEARKTGYRKIYLAPGAHHAESFNTNPAEYDRQVGEFLQEIAG